MGELLREGEIHDVQIDMLKPPRSVYRHIDSTKVKQLAESISLFGLRHPITISEDRSIISGNHRVAAMKTLGKKTIRAEILPISGVMARILMIDENLIRSELTLLEQSEHLAERNRLLIELGQRTESGKHVGKTDPDGERGDGTRDSAGQPPIKTTKDIANDMGIAERTLQEKLQIANAIDKSARDKLRDTDISDNKTELIRLAKIKSPGDQNTIVDMVISGECKTIKDAVALFMRGKQTKEFDDIATEVKKLPDTIKLICGDFFDSEDAENFPKHNSIDVIITSPPGEDDWKENWAPFLGISADILKPGGVLVAFVEHARLPEFFDGLMETQVESSSKVSKNNKLEFYWMCSLNNNDTIRAVHTRGVQSEFTPIVIAFKPPMKKPYKYLNDVLKSGGHLSINELIPIIDSFSRP